MNCEPDWTQQSAQYVTQVVVGVFRNAGAASRAKGHLLGLGLDLDRLTIFTPGLGNLLSEEETSDSEGEGMTLFLFLPDVGAVSVVGALATTLLGASVAGDTATVMLGRKSLVGLFPLDEVFVYEDALFRGCTLILVTADEPVASAVRQIFAAVGAESLDRAKDNWWKGIRDARRLKYISRESTILWDDPLCRLGFETAVRHAGMELSEPEGEELLKRDYPGMESDDAFWPGYVEGRTYVRQHWMRDDRFSA